MTVPDDAPVTEPLPPPAEALPVAPGNPLHIAHEDHDHDPSNPHYFGLPIGVILAGIVAVISVALVVIKFVHPSALR